MSPLKESRGGSPTCSKGQTFSLTDEQPLGAEAMDTRLEGFRLAEFAKFKPNYYLDQDNEVDLAGSRWRILATTDIENSEDAHFLSVIHKWTLAAETVIPPVARTEIVEAIDSKELKDAVTHTRRRLIPKRIEKDNVVVEDVVVNRWENGLYARFIPCMQDPSDIPFYYPKVFEYAFGYVESNTEAHNSSNQLSILVREPAHFSATATKKQKLVWRDLLKRLYKWTVTERFGYQKRAEHDVIIDYERYTAKYQELKAKYAAYWVENWPEQTDPKKFVYEDIAITSWIICLWEKEREADAGLSWQTFVDLGCGNGLLVYLLNKEGYSGYGVDQCSRKVWTKFGSGIDLRAETIEPFRFQTDASWIIGNHADELVPWIPIISARTPKNHPRFIVIPCCLHDLSGQKMTFAVSAGQSKYHAYVQYISELAADCGFGIEKEFLRIPSTKNVAIVGRPQVNEDRSGVWLDTAEKLAKQGQEQFVPRVPDSVKNEVRLLKAQSRKDHLT
ncbi:tRNA(Ser) Um(44) 2'-O-methyltransferase [Coemansia sp. RSA 1646]|nr:tRNA(Ser) Um(44) 2'-O-methyltransferase [Coemansia sp. RSA 1646]KAJ2089947.1 tRNA(Ser) Um(44) 2'-O-methyltransferase [Coemansia sp. RSA 986]